MAGGIHGYENCDGFTVTQTVSLRRFVITVAGILRQVPQTNSLRYKVLRFE